MNHTDLLNFQHFCLHFQQKKYYQERTEIENQLSDAEDEKQRKYDEYMKKSAEFSEAINNMEFLKSRMFYYW